MRKLVMLWAALLLIWTACPALAAEDELPTLTDEELLDMMAEVPAEGEEDNSSFLVLPEDFNMADEDVFNVLLVGTDAYTDDHRGRSDSVILVSVNAETKRIRMVSFLRDLYVKIPGKGSNRLNASYIWGGEKLLRRTLEENFGVTADAYVEVNFERLTKVIDAIGGVTVEVSEAEQRQVNSILRFYNEKTGAPESEELLREHGVVCLTGKQALCFSRIRKIDGDFQRSERQRKVVEAAFHQVMTMDWASITALVLDNLDMVQTDLTMEDVVQLVPLAIRCRNASFETLTIPVTGAYSNTTVDGMAVIRPNLKKNRQALHDFLNGEQ